MLGNIPGNWELVGNLGDDEDAGGGAEAGEVLMLPPGLVFSRDGAMGEVSSSSIETDRDLLVLIGLS